MKREADVKEEVKRILGSYEGRVWWFMPVPAGFGVQGVPDFICSVGGLFVGIETKFGSNGLSKWQAKQVGAITRSKGVHLTINEKSVDSLQAMIDGLLALGGS